MWPLMDLSAISTWSTRLHRPLDIHIKKRSIEIIENIIAVEKGIKFYPINTRMAKQISVTFYKKIWETNDPFLPSDQGNTILHFLRQVHIFLASQHALEVMRVTE